MLHVVLVIMLLSVIVSSVRRDPTRMSKVLVEAPARPVLEAASLQELEMHTVYCVKQVQVNSDMIY